MGQRRDQANVNLHQDHSHGHHQHHGHQLHATHHDQNQDTREVPKSYYDELYEHKQHPEETAQFQINETETDEYRVKTQDDEQQDIRDRSQSHLSNKFEAHSDQHANQNRDHNGQEKVKDTKDVSDKDKDVNEPDDLDTIGTAVTNMAVSAGKKIGEALQYVSDTINAVFVESPEDLQVQGQQKQKPSDVKDRNVKNQQGGNQADANDAHNDQTKDLGQHHHPDVKADDLKLADTTNANNRNVHGGIQAVNQQNLGQVSSQEGKKSNFNQDNNQPELIEEYQEVIQVIREDHHPDINVDEVKLADTALGNDNTTDTRQDKNFNEGQDQKNMGLGQNQVQQSQGQNQPSSLNQGGNQEKYKDAIWVSQQHHHPDTNVDDVKLAGAIPTNDDASNKLGKDVQFSNDQSAPRDDSKQGFNNPEHPHLPHHYQAQDNKLTDKQNKNLSSDQAK